MKIIINADDFGYSSATNIGIKKALKYGLISSTSILANMPGFDEAVAMAKSKDFIGRVGAHLNLFEGKPLTEEMQACSLFCDENGIFHGNTDEKGIYRGKKLAIFDPLKIRSSVIFNELSAQLDKIISAGILPTHLDSHGQIHTNYFIGNIIIKVAQQFKIPAIRINSNLRSRRNIFSELEIYIYNSRLKWQGIKHVDYLGTIEEITLALPKLAGIVEVIVHPIYQNGSLMDADNAGELANLLSPFHGKVKISYSEL